MGALTLMVQLAFYTFYIHSIFPHLYGISTFVVFIFRSKTNNLDPMEVVDILEESAQHLYRIYLSMLANTLAVKKTKKISDCLLHKDKYASDVAIATLSEITNILNSMDIAVHTQMKVMLVLWKA